MPAVSLQLRSLKLRLLLPYAVLIVVLTGVIGGLTYLAGARTVTNLSDNMLKEMAARMRQNIQHHVSGSAAVLEAAFPSGMAAPQDMRTDWLALRNRLWAATTLHPRTNSYVYYGNIGGQGVGLKRQPDGTAELRIRAEGDQHRRYYSLSSIDSTQHYLRTERAMFDPRNRPWFQLASQVDHHTWTSVYIDFGIKDLVLTRARRVLNTHGDFEGVVATDVSLSALNDVVDELARSVKGLAFVVESSGELVAISGMKNVRFTDAGRIERLTTQTGGNALANSIYQQIQSYFNEAVPQTGNTDYLFNVRSLQLKNQDDEPVHVAFVRVTDHAGLDWMAAVAVPRATILADVSRLVELVVVVGVLCLLIALAIGMRLFGRIADDVRSLSNAVKRVGQGDISSSFETNRSDEVGELARNFSHMRQELFTDRVTGVSNRSALQHVLASLITPPSSSAMAAPFALLFLDLNLFKALNDQWGHDNGDRALAEVAQRLRHHVRTDDHVARLGGDEFVVVLRGVDNMEVAETTSAKLVELISAPLTTLQGIPDGVVVHLGASIGIALYPHDAKDAQSLLKRADQQMYAKKALRPSAHQR
ncbi:diguanylate cyclase domain-containing protein [Comamonas sp.]|uniref:diguanylate cyclase domain-containing protein n=1 Tax=Comamonas sp. TaxID=34028 RepID=UPI002FCA52B8